MEVKKPHLTFMVQQATDSKRIYDSKVVENDGEANEEYSIDDSNKEMVPYDLKALLSSCQPSVDHNQTEEKTDILPKTDAPTTFKSLFSEGFHANSAFDSLRGSPTAKGTTAPINGSWHRDPPPPPACPVTIANNISSSNEDEVVEDDIEDDDNEDWGIDARAKTVAPTGQNRP